ncbi:MAG: sugar transferase [Chloroflexi bacterium]|nr:sugar transferase [Chloroflexota bacterium]
MALGDWAAAALAFFAVSFVRFGDGQWIEFWQRLRIDISEAAFLFGLIWTFALWSQGLYAHRTKWPLKTEVKQIARATLMVAAFTLSTLFLTRETEVSRLFLLVLFVGTPSAALASRAIVRLLFAAARERGLFQRELLIIGTGDLAQSFADRFESRRSLGFRVVGHVTTSADAGEPSRPVLGRLEDLERILHTRAVDEIVICGPLGGGDQTAALSELAASEGKPLHVVLPQRRTTSRATVEEMLDGFVVRSAVYHTGREFSFLLKRAVDIAGAAIGLLAFSPLLLIAAVLIRHHDGGPVLFRQERVGLHGRLFTIYKLRTMTVDAEDRFAELATRSATSGPAFKMVDDPRVTRIGRTLRRLSIDELPQLFNVLRGEMSLVGPRPAPGREVREYDVWHRRRLSMKPGITGLWQVRSRLDENFDDRVELDLTYIEQWSPALDLKLIFLTVPAVFLRRGY